MAPARPRVENRSPGRARQLEKPSTEQDVVSPDESNIFHQIFNQKIPILSKTNNDSPFLTVLKFGIDGVVLPVFVFWRVSTHSKNFSRFGVSTHSEIGRFRDGSAAESRLVANHRC